MAVDTGLQPVAIAINAASPSLAVIFVMLRLYSQRYITRNLGWDDTFIVVSMVLAITMAVSFHLGKICPGLRALVAWGGGGETVAPWKTTDFKQQ